MTPASSTAAAPWPHGTSKSAGSSAIKAGSTLPTAASRRPGSSTRRSSRRPRRIRTARATWGTTLSRVAEECYGSRDYARAIDYSRRAIAVLSGFMSAHPERLDHRRNLAAVYNNLGSALWYIKDYRGSAEAHLAGQFHLCRTAQGQPGKPTGPGGARYLPDEPGERLLVFWRPERRGRIVPPGRRNRIRAGPQFTGPAAIRKRLAKYTHRFRAAGMRRATRARAGARTSRLAAGTRRPRSSSFTRRPRLHRARLRRRSLLSRRLPELLPPIG